MHLYLNCLVKFFHVFILVSLLACNWIDLSRFPYYLILTTSFLASTSNLPKGVTPETVYVTIISQYQNMISPCFDVYHFFISECLYLY